MTSLVLHIEFPSHQPLAEILACAQEIVDQAEYLDARVSTSATGLSQAAAEMLADALEVPPLPNAPRTEEEMVNLMRQRIGKAFDGHNGSELAHYFGVSVPFVYASVAAERQTNRLLNRLAELGGSELAERIRTEFGGTSQFIPRFAPRCSAEPDAGSGTAPVSGQPAEPSP